MGVAVGAGPPAAGPALPAHRGAGLAPGVCGCAGFDEAACGRYGWVMGRLLVEAPGRRGKGG
jgi:hypothetical protein